MSLADVIKLYRISGKPIFDGISFSGKIKFNENRRLIVSLYEHYSHFGSFKDIVVDGIDIFSPEDLPNSGEEIHYTFKINQGSAERFYPTKSEFISINSLKKGEIPSSYYIVSDDYCPQDQSKPDYIIKIETICNLIKNLSTIAHFNDIKNDSNGSYFKLVFILHSESKSSSAVIETTLNEEILNTENLDTSIVDALASKDADKDIHYIEKLNTFRNTLIEYVNQNTNSFPILVEKWNSINNLYINNLAIYMSAFSFHKSRKEVSEAELEYADKISKVISELSIKALAIPISMAASIAIFQSATKSDATIAFLGILFASLITSLLCISQIKQLDRIVHAKETLFAGIEDRLNTEQSDIKERLNSANSHLRSNETFCRRVLDFIFASAWVPTCIGTIGLIQKFF
ncbi:hypothetical protein [Pantoea ananatis]|uniref:hypothetical protein n=1 Tax=Pantoea ananas TaxID=553 RepID=UPI00244BD337|nr:hypothetical protein [Pantoea ananatis]MDH0055730.1 hypothetical protein [Pantoea ananatis]